MTSSSTVLEAAILLKATIYGRIVFKNLIKDNSNDVYINIYQKDGLEVVFIEF